MELTWKLFVIILFPWILSISTGQSNFSAESSSEYKLFERYIVSPGHDVHSDDDNGEERFLRSTLFSAKAIIEDIQNSLTQHLNDYVKRSEKIQKLTLMAQNQPNEFLKQISTGNDKLCHFLKNCKSTSTVKPNSTDIDRSDFLADSNESTNYSDDTEVRHRQGVLRGRESNSEENDTSEVSMEGSNEKREPRQAIPSPVSSLFPIAEFAIVFPILIANVAMSLIVLSFNIASRSDSPRLSEIHQEQLNALAAFGGVPESVLDPNPDNATTRNDVINDSDESGSSEYIEISKLQRLGHPFDRPLNIFNVADSYHHLIQQFQHVVPYLLRVLVFVSLFTLLYQLYARSLTHGVIILALLAISDMYLRYSKENSDEGKWNRSYDISKHFSLSNMKSLDETTNIIIEALERLAHLDNDPIT